MNILENKIYYKILEISNDKLNITSTGRLDIPDESILSMNHCSNEYCPMNWFCLRYRLWVDYNSRFPDTVRSVASLACDQQNNYIPDNFLGDINLFMIERWNEETYKINFENIVSLYYIL